MISLYVHFYWFVCLFTSFLVILLFSLALSFIGNSFYLSFPIYFSSVADFSLSMYFDFYSSWFLCAVLLISSFISIYSYFYIAPYSKPTYFLWFTIFFILSMLITICFSDLIMVILGWDGLGLVSFFLIVYYQNTSSIVSGIFTVLINRLGDCFFLLSIVCFFYYSSSFYPFCFYSLESWIMLVLGITFITNSAIFPFSSWLPLAMAAPTPISALVHSSTLVTSGLFLIIRYSYFLYSCYSFITLLSVLSVFTSFYAGLNALVEFDLNKLIALSTLSHLGFIGLSFSLGLTSLAFFHLLAHALFKSLLFIAIGDIMISLSHSQDIRYLSLGSLYTPFSSWIMLVSVLNLLGLPSISGFFSNDLVLESINYSYSGVFVSCLLLFNVAFTYFYTLRLFYFTYQSNNLSPFNSFHFPMVSHGLVLFLSGVISVVFGYIFLLFTPLFVSFPLVPFYLKFYPLFLCFIFITYLILFKAFPLVRSVFLNTYFSTMLFISNLLLSFSSLSYFTFFSSSLNASESGGFNYFANNVPFFLVTNFSSFTAATVSFSPLLVIISFVMLVFFII